MKINFFLPNAPTTPGGGSKIMFEFANKLAERGHDVCVYGSLKTSYLVSGRYRPYLDYLLQVFTGKNKPNWFEAHPKIKWRIIPKISDLYVRNADVIMSTWWSVALDLDNLSKRKGKRFNYIQDYENWIGHIDKLHESYSLENTRNITIANYLVKKIKDITTTEPIYLPYGIDQKRFDIFKSVELRDRARVIMLYSEEARKDSKTSIKALHKVKGTCPELSAIMFGVYEQPKDLPDWIEYHKRPDNIPELFNEASIFIQSSVQEGLSLNPVEAKSCGCACIYTNIPGHMDHSVEGVNCLLFDVGDYNALADHITELIINDSERIMLARIGYMQIRKSYSWTNAINNLEKLFQDSINNREG